MLNIGAVFSTLNLRALGIAALATLLLIAGVFVGSRNLQNFDAALVPYLVGTLFAAFAIVYRYVVWLQRPPTWRFFKRFVPPLLLGWTMGYLGSPAWAYTGMALFALLCLAVNGWFYHRRNSPTHC